MIKLFASLIFLCLIAGAKVSALDYRTDTVAVRELLDSNGLASISVSSVSDSVQGRIVKLILYGKSLHVIPSSIGNLSELDTFNLNDNELTNLPLSIVSLNCIIEIFNNRLCHVSDSVSNWLDIHSICYSVCLPWIASQRCNSVIAANRYSCAIKSPPLFSYIITGNMLIFSCEFAASARMVAQFYAVSGKLICKASGVGNLSISLSNIPQSVFAIDLIINDMPSFLIISTKR
jgi:hypothetical protein